MEIHRATIDEHLAGFTKASLSSKLAKTSAQSGSYMRHKAQRGLE